MRLCVNYRGLNDLTIKDCMPLPLISETLDRLSRAQVFSTLDLKDAYYRIPIKRSDEWKTTFRTRYSHFKYMVMPSPGSSQSFFSTVDRLIDRLWLSQLVKRSLRVSVNHSDWSVNPQWLNNG
jgi:hypothetical protein